MRVFLIITTVLATLMGLAAQSYAGKFVEFESGEGISPTKYGSLVILLVLRAAGLSRRSLSCTAAPAFTRICLHGRTGFVAGGTSPLRLTASGLAKLR